MTATSIRAVDASLGGTNIRIANRRIVTTSLKKCLAVDLMISGFDIHERSGLMITAAGKVIYLWDLQKLVIIHKFGRLMGSVHKENILTVRFDPSGEHLASAGEDKKVVVWNTKSHRSQKILDGHKGLINLVEFSADGENIVSASEDGRVYVWEWKTGHLLHTFMRHSAAVKSFTVCPDHPGRILSGCADGNIMVWDLAVKGIVDNIIPDPDWVSQKDELSLIGWMDMEKHHSGTIMALDISPNGRLLISASTDNTAKLWSIVSYIKDVDAIQLDLMQLERLIDVKEEKYNQQILQRDFSGLKIGEVPIPTGYHADLIFTYRHESTVLCATFNHDSDIVVTGSADSTCRLWSCRRGDLLFQINVPAPVSVIRLSPSSNDMYVICHNRMLVFGVQANEKEEELPEYWKRHEVDFSSTPLGKSRNPNEHDAERSDVKSSGKTKTTIEELKQMISHGLVLPSFLNDLLEQFPMIDAAQLYSNMSKYGLQARQVLRLIVNSKFHPKDILTMLASKQNAEVVYNTVLSGAPITYIMINHGFKMVTGDHPEDAKSILLDYRDFRSPSHYGAARQSAWSNQQGPGRNYDPDDPYYQYLDDEEYEWYSPGHNRDGYGESDPNFNSARQQRGQILHFIPSEQIKLLKDYHARRTVKPIFLRQIVLESVKRELPNFNVNSIHKDTRPTVVERPIKKEGVRFNEPQGRFQPLKFKNKVGNVQSVHGVGIARKEANRMFALPLQKEPKGLVSSSTTIFKPERYLRTRGLNVRFDSTNRHGTLLQGHVYAEPIILGENTRMDWKQAFVVGKSIGIKEATIDEEGMRL